jgi:hypothetical protein
MFGYLSFIHSTYLYQRYNRSHTRYSKHSHGLYSSPIFLTKIEPFLSNLQQFGGNYFRVERNSAVKWLQEFAGGTFCSGLSKY